MNDKRSARVARQATDVPESPFGEPGRQRNRTAAVHLSRHRVAQAVAADPSRDGNSTSRRRPSGDRRRAAAPTPERRGSK